MFGWPSGNRCWCQHLLCHGTLSSGTQTHTREEESERDAGCASERKSILDHVSRGFMEEDAYLIAKKKRKKKTFHMSNTSCEERGKAQPHVQRFTQLNRLKKRLKMENGESFELFLFSFEFRLKNSLITRGAVRSSSYTDSLNSTARCAEILICMGF